MLSSTVLHPHCGARVALRQQILVLYLGGSDLGNEVTAWAFYDGTSSTETIPDELDDSPPYRNGLEALRDGWRLLSWPRLTPHTDETYALGYLPHEFVFEKIQGDPA